VGRPPTPAKPGRRICLRHGEPAPDPHPTWNGPSLRRPRRRIPTGPGRDHQPCPRSLSHRASAPSPATGCARPGHPSGVAGAACRRGRRARRRGHSGGTAGRPRIPLLLSNTVPPEQVLTVRAGTPPRIDGLTDGLTPAHLRTGPHPGEWSVTQVLAHRPAGADVWGDCIATRVAEARPVLSAVYSHTPIQRTDDPEREVGRRPRHPRAGRARASSGSRRRQRVATRSIVHPAASAGRPADGRGQGRLRPARLAGSPPAPPGIAARLGAARSRPLLCLRSAVRGRPYPRIGVVPPLRPLPGPVSAAAGCAPGRAGWRGAPPADA